MKTESHFMSSRTMLSQAKKAVSSYQKYLAGWSPSVIFDLGACVGVYAYYLSKAFPSASVYAFEPIMAHYVMLQRHVMLNGISRQVACHPFGFLAQEGERTLGIPDYPRLPVENTGSYSVLGGRNEVRGYFRVLDEWCKVHTLYPDFIKMDVEGAELEILQSSPCCFGKARYLVIEENVRYTVPEVRKILAKYGYRQVGKKLVHDTFWERDE